MNILYLADPNDNHDLKWISFFVEKKAARAFLMPRNIHRIPIQFQLHNPGLELVESIPNFSTFRFYETLVTAIRIKRFIRKNKIDLIHVLFAEPNALWCLFRNFFSIPIVVTCRGTDVLKTIPATFKKKSLINFFVSAAYRTAFAKADYVTGTSQKQLDSISHFAGRTEKMSVVRTGVDVPKLMADTSAFFPIKSGAPYILFPRYIKPMYNHEFCIDAIALLPPDAKEKYTMVFVGKDKDEKELPYQHLLEEKMQATAGVEFIFLPEVSQDAIFELYKRAELVVMTPLSDGSPVSAMDAIACGAKVILGPLAYDEEIFKSWTYQIKTWNSRELSELIIHCLSVQNTVDILTYIPLVNRTREMSKVSKIYDQVLHQPEAKENSKEKKNLVPAIMIRYEQCSHCLLDTHDDPEITFDQGGVCSYCRQYEVMDAKFVRRGEAGESELKRLAGLIKESGKGRPYDSIIGISGGVDSTYLAYQARKLGLRPLAVHFDNGWNSELAVNNIENIIKRLGFDLHTFVVDWEEFRDIQLSFMKASVVDIELVTDHAIITKLHQLAIQYKIKYILSGTNVVTEAILPRSWIHDKRDHIHIRAIQERFGSIPITTYPLFTSTLKWRVVWRGIKSVSFLDLMPYRKKEVKNIIAKELGWRDYGGKHYESVFTRFYQGHILPTKFGIDKRKAHLSNLICSGQLTREEALEELAKPAYDSAMRNSDYEFVLKKLGLTSQEFEAIMKAPVRPHTDFPVEESIYDRIPLLRIMRPAWQQIKKLRKLT